MSATGLLNFLHGATHAIDQRFHICRYFVTAPSNMAVRTHQNKTAAVALQHFRLAQRHDLKRHLSLRGRARERRGIRRFGSKSEQDETASEEIEG